MYQINEGITVSRNGQHGELITPVGHVTFGIEGMADQCGMTLISHVRFYESTSDIRALEQHFNEFLCAPYLTPDVGWDEEEEERMPFANVLNTSMLVLTDSNEYAGDEYTASLWNMCTRSKRWCKGASNINANTSNEVAVFTHNRKREDYDQNY